jgi:hypothetical protein
MLKVEYAILDKGIVKGKNIGVATIFYQILWILLLLLLLSHKWKQSIAENN